MRGDFRFFYKQGVGIQGQLILTVNVLEQNEYIMKLIVQVFILVANYLFSKLVVFGKKREGEKKDV